MRSEVWDSSCHRQGDSVGDQGGSSSRSAHQMRTALESARNVSIRSPSDNTQPTEDDSANDLRDHSRLPKPFKTELEQTRNADDQSLCQGVEVRFGETRIESRRTAWTINKTMGLGDSKEARRSAGVHERRGGGMRARIQSGAPPARGGGRKYRSIPQLDTIQDFLPRHPSFPHSTPWLPQKMTWQAHKSLIAPDRAQLIVGNGASRERTYSVGSKFTGSGGKSGSA